MARVQKDIGRQLHVKIPEDLYKRLKVKCVYDDISMQDYVSKLIAESIAEYSSAEEEPAGRRPNIRQGRKGSGERG